MVGRRPSIALKELKKYWGEVDVVTGLFKPWMRRYDLVIAQEPTMRIGFPALVQAKLSRAFFISEVHGDYLQSKFLPFKDKLSATIVLRGSDYVRAVNSTIAANLRLLGVRNVLTIPAVYVDTKLFKPLTAHEQRANTVVTAARLVPEKGLDLLIASVPDILEKFADLRVVIIGDGVEKAHLQKLTRDKGLQEVVRFPGWISHEQLFLYYNEAAVFVCTSFSEGGPRTVFEAAACQTPFVSTAVGLVREVFEHGRHGFILQKRDSKLLAEYIIHLLENPGLREEMGLRAREVVEREFEWGRAVRRYATAYLKIVEGRV
ncbi:MAG: glycosyltransferase family 4 protein [Candidatus Caldarchaeum sp.]|nr:glycosyltransferase family 4 protein [Candidatus Caldarchaeum sp.]